MPLAPPPPPRSGADVPRASARPADSQLSEPSAWADRAPCERAACTCAVPIPTTAVKLGGKAPVVASASFVAPSANLLGAVHLGEGASAWYGSLLKGTTSTVEIGEMSSVGDRAVIVDSIVGKNALIGAGAILQSAQVGDGCSVGMGCKVGKGAKLMSGSSLAAGSVLPAGAVVPAGQVWSGSPASYVSDVSSEAADGVVRSAEVTMELSKVHMDEAWKDLALVEQARGARLGTRRRRRKLMRPPATPLPLPPYCLQSSAPNFPTPPPPAPRPSAPL